MQSTVTGIFMWSRWQQERGLFFNSFFFEHPDGNYLVDPLALGEDDAAEIDRRGGAAWIVVTNRDHLREASAMRARFGAKIAISAADAPLVDGVRFDRLLRDGDAIGGAIVIALTGLKTEGEFALFFAERSAVLVGDALWGDPAGSVRLMPDEKLADPPGATLSLRRIAACNAEHLLVGDGACIFGGATAAMWKALEARPGAYVNAANIETLPLVPDPIPQGTRGRYDGLHFCDVGRLIGAKRLGYSFFRLDPGASLCPMHWHTMEEELFVIFAGTGTLRTPGGERPVREGDLIAFPTRASGAHQITATGTEPLELLAIANIDAGDVCLYPDSQKLLVESLGTIVRDTPALDYWDGE